jgi:hypothetical protein
MLRCCLNIITTTSILFIGIPHANAQLTGIIKNSKNGEPIEGVEVFINKTTIAGQTNEFGEFRLDNLPVGFYEIVLYRPEYDIFRSQFRVQENRSYNLNLTLKPASKDKSKKIGQGDIFFLRKELFGNAVNVSAIDNLANINLVTTKNDRTFANGAIISIEHKCTLSFPKFYYY